MVTLHRTLAAVAVALTAVMTVDVTVPAQAAEGPQRITGGSVASATAAPWQVALFDPDEGSRASDSDFCGGSVINAQWVVTAARCLDNYPNSTVLGVFAGSTDLTDSLNLYGYESTRRIVHPGFRGNINDIALVKVNDSFDLSLSTLDPVVLPLDVNGSTFPAVGETLLATGWGLSSPTNPASAQTILRSVELQSLAAPGSTTCGSTPVADWNTRYELCVGVPGGGSDFCTGDIGGPITADGIDGDGDLETEAVLVGIASWGGGCGNASRPSLALRVSTYLDWIIPNRPTMAVSYSSKTKKHTVKWTAVTNQLVASPVTGFRIEYSTNYGMSWRNGATVAPTARSYSQKIARDTLWRVAAVNEVNSGLGPYLWADTSGYLGDRVIAVPSVPTGFSGAVSSAGNIIRFKWSEPVSANGSLIYKYRLYRQIGNATPVRLFEISPIPGISDEVVRTLTATVQRERGSAKFWITAVNNSGESAPSTQVTIN
jgi:secreted trypsin-like serine protease